MRPSRAARLVIVCGTALLFSAAAEAQGLVRFVSSSGSDSNPCTRALPCRTLQAGVNASPAGGEVQVLDSGEYGAGVTIGKSVTISAIGISATVLGTIGVNAPASARVVLRGLHLNGTHSVQYGIIITQAESVHVEDCVVERFSISGIVGSGASLFVSNIVSRDNTNSGLHFSGPLVVSDSHFEDNGYDGLSASGEATVVRSSASQNNVNGMVSYGGRMSVAWSMVAHNDRYGFSAEEGFTCDVCFRKGEMTVEQSAARGNADSGFFVSALGSEISVGRMSNTVVTNNAVGVANTGIVETRGNNTVSGNGTNVSNAAGLAPLAPM